jgi:hypothetical protein
MAQFRPLIDPPSSGSAPSQSSGGSVRETSRRAQLEQLIANPGTDRSAAFRRRLAQLLLADGRPLATIARASASKADSLRLDLITPDRLPAQDRLGRLVAVLGPAAADLLTLAAEARGTRSPAMIERRHRAASAGGRATARARTLEEHRDWQAGTIQTRKGYGWFKSDETRALHTERWRASGAPEKAREAWRASGGPAALASAAREWGQRRRAESETKGGGRLLCVFCQNPDDLVDREPWQRKPDPRARNQSPRLVPPYHRRCYEEWRRTPEMREKSRTFGTLGQIRQRVKQYGSATLLAEVDSQIKAELRRLRDISAPGPPPKLLENRPLAIEMARLQHDGALSAVEVAGFADLLSYAPGRTDPEPNRTAWRLLAIGRALLGYERLEPGPRRRRAS